MPAPTDTASPATTGHAHDWRGGLARFGLAGKGVLHLVIALSVYRLANGSGSGSEASSTGAVRWIADQPGGTIALWVLAASLASLAVWRAVTTVLGDVAGEDDGWHRLSFAAKAVVYGLLAVLCVRTALSGSSGGSGSASSGGDSTEQTASSVFDLPFGRWIVFAVGVAVMAIAVHLIMVHTIDGRFVERLDVGRRSAAVRLGRIGYGLRSIAYIVVGFFLAQAGLSYDQNQAKGLSGSLRSVADESWGSTLLYTVAVGFGAYGLYCFFESRHRSRA